MMATARSAFYNFIFEVPISSASSVHHSISVILWNSSALRSFRCTLNNIECYISLKSLHIPYSVNYIVNQSLKKISTQVVGVSALHMTTSASRATEQSGQVVSDGGS